MALHIFLKTSSSDNIVCVLALSPSYLGIVVAIITQGKQTLSLMDGSSHSSPNAVPSITHKQNYTLMSTAELWPNT